MINKLQLKDILETIKETTYTKLPSGKSIVCELTLNNGYTIHGISSLIDKKDFDYDIGCKIAYDKAVDKIWELEGYLLQEFLLKHVN